MTDSHPLYLAILWHMHQPYYKDINSGKYIMPWVRLHGTKDYLDMVELLSEFPRIRINFNMAPSLLEQISDYVEREATDLFLDLTLRPAELLNASEKLFILEKFFFAHYDNMIKPYTRYRELYEKRGWAKSDAELMRVAQYFTDDDFRDLQAWHNLAWIDPLERERDEALAALIRKGRDFTEHDKQTIILKQRQMMARIVPVWRECAERGQIEISTTPFYHPILPLIIDTDSALVARPDITLPRKRFSHPDDARDHVRRAAQFHEQMFGQRPRGMWPAEGAVSPATIPLFASENIQWIATDETILARSLGQPVRRGADGTVLNSGMLYQPYMAEHDGARVAVIFRDQFISDLVGFQYPSLPADEAAADILARLEKIADNTRELNRPALVTLILDGENCWEHYRDDGLPFLRKFYQMISESSRIVTIRICDYLDHYPPAQILPQIFSGSWINGDFSIWIGHREDNQSWDYLHEVRDMVESHIGKYHATLTTAQVEAARKELMIAEGSDWNWWYGDDHSSGIDDEFDQLYRAHLRSACDILGIPPPSFLFIPIKTQGLTGCARDPRAFIKPVIDGRNTSYFEWFAAGQYDPSMGGGAMHQAQYLIRRLCYGFDQDNLYFRIDCNHKIIKTVPRDRVTLNLSLIARESWTIIMALQGRHNTAQPDSEKPVALLGRQTDMDFELISELPNFAVGQVVELAVPFTTLNIENTEEIQFFVTLEVNGREIERCPARMPLRLKAPYDNFETKMWVV
ncbi:MAG: glycoside hydrolase family 57 protein [bacterium]|nr:glycoside hydrolase family 57 protein [Candidatus Sumerlaeota bacterium]